MTDFTENDPRYVRISKKQAAEILGVSVADFDIKRKRDPDCPKGVSSGKSKTCKVLFIKQDVYDYSLLLHNRAPEEQERINAL